MTVVYPYLVLTIGKRRRNGKIYPVRIYFDYCCPLACRTGKGFDINMGIRCAFYITMSQVAAKYRNGSSSFSLVWAKPPGICFIDSNGSTPAGIIARPYKVHRPG